MAQNVSQLQLYSTGNSKTEYILRGIKMDTKHVPEKSTTEEKTINHFMLPLFEKFTMQIGNNYASSNCNKCDGLFPVLKAGNLCEHCFEKSRKTLRCISCKEKKNSHFFEGRCKKCQIKFLGDKCPTCIQCKKHRMGNLIEGRCKKCHTNFWNQHNKCKTCGRDCKFLFYERQCDFCFEHGQIGNFVACSIHNRSEHCIHNDT